MDPVSIVVLALAKGAIAGIGKEAGVDGYRVLKSYIAARYGRRVEQAIDRLEVDPQSTLARNQLGDQLRAAGADRDTELKHLADRLIQLVEHPEQMEPSRIADPVEELRRSTGLDAVDGLLERHVQTIRVARSQYEIEDTDLLSGRVTSPRDVPEAVRAELSALHGRIRAVVEQIAAAIQLGRYNDVERALQDLEAGRSEQVRAHRLVEADKRLQISYESLRLTVEFFSQLNQRVLIRMEQVPDSAQLSTMMFGNAVMIYEITDFVIGFIERFHLENDLDALHADAMRSVQRTRDKQESLRQRAQDDRIDHDVRTQILEDVHWRESALAAVEQEWSKYLHEVADMNGKVRDVRNRIPTLELIRDGAEVQVETLQQIALLRFLKQNSSSIQGAVNTLQGLRLAPMTASRVRVLLGIDAR